MLRFRIQLLRIAIALVIMVFSGCPLPKGCFDKLSELKTAKAEVRSVLFIDDPHVDPETGKPRSQPSTKTEPSITKRTPTCTEFVKLRLDDTQIVIFVDKNQSGADKSGQTWQSAMPSIAAAVTRAFDIRAAEIGGPVEKKINIVVAGNDYTLEHEFGNDPLFRNAPIIDIGGRRRDVLKNIHILGGYRSGDACLERLKNLETDPQGEAGRTTTLDGKNGAHYSNHVVQIAGDAESITVSHFTIRHGKALGMMYDHDRFGGAILVRTAAKDIVLEELTVEVAQADKRGGCIAIIGDAPNAPTRITLRDVTLDGCTAQRGGGGIYIGGAAHTITATRLFVKNSVTTHANSIGGGILINQNAGHHGADDNITFTNLTVEGNTAGKAGGGVYIGGKDLLRPELPGKIVIDSARIINNRTLTANTSFGGGLAIVALQAASGPIKMRQGEITGNHAQLKGGGVYIGDTVNRPPGAAANFQFNNVHVDRNHLDAPAPGATPRGAGMMVDGPSGDIVIAQNSSISQNEADGEGIGLAIHGDVANVTIDHARIKDNIVKNGLIPKDGNGVWIEEGPLGETPTAIVLRHNEISNHHHGRNGAGLYVHGASVELSNLTFERNFSSGDGGAAFLHDNHIVAHQDNKYRFNRAQNGGGLFVNGSRTLALGGLGNATQPFDMRNIKCTGNTAINHGGCIAIERAPGTVVDGGRYKDNGGALLAVPGFAQATRRGGAIYYVSNSVLGGNDNAAKFEVHNTEFADNSANERGGAVYLENVFAIEIRQNVKFTGNIVHANALLPINGRGGAIFVDASQYNNALLLAHQNGAKVVISDNVEFSSNRAPNGGAVFFEPRLRKMEIKDKSVFEDNRAVGGHGGAFYVPRVNKLTMTGVKLISNTAMGNGGAIAIDLVDESVTIDNNPVNTSLWRFYNSLRQRVGGLAGDAGVENDIGRATRNVASGDGGAYYFGSIARNLTVSNQILVNNTANNGGAIHVGQFIPWVGPLFPAPHGNAIEIRSTILSGNNAVINGGGVNLPDAGGARTNFTIIQHDGGGMLGPEYVANRKLRKNLANFYLFVNDLAHFTLNNLDNTDLPHAKEGMFLVQGNVAAHNGGAIYINNIGNVTLDRMSLANNHANGGIGGTLFIDNLIDVLLIDDSIIYGGYARDNAGAVYVRGTPVANRYRKLLVLHSSIQSSSVHGGVGINGSAGIFLTRMNYMHLTSSNFFANKVLAPQAGTVWAAAAKFFDVTGDPLPLINPGYVGMGGNPLQGGAEAPVEVQAPVLLHDNQVQNPLIAGSIGTISIPHVLHDVNAATGQGHYYLYPHAHTFNQVNNLPATIDNHPRNVVIAH